MHKQLGTLMHQQASRSCRSLGLGATWESRQPRQTHERWMSKLSAVATDLSQESGVQVPKIQWYPGHIAKAERTLKEQLSMVDVVLEVRDARIPVATTHKLIPEWCGHKQRILVMNRVDMISENDKKAWSAALNRQKQPAFWTNGMTGIGVNQLAKATASFNAEINAARRERGLKGRPVRVCVIGFPNIGKSALINRLLKKKACESAAKPGVTRGLRWVRVGGDLDLLDAPGVIPMSFNDQRAAHLLAVCNDIGEAAYLASHVGVCLVDTMLSLPSKSWTIPKLAQRWSIDLTASMTGEDYVYALADKKYQGDTERAGQRLLNDYRSGYLGNFALELP